MALLICLRLLVGIRVIIIKQHWKLLALATVLFGVLCSLGTWQFFRLYEKKAYIQSIERGLAAPPKPWEPEQKLPPFTRVILKGKFVDVPPFPLTTKTYEGQVGHYVVSPFQTQQGPWILILRGWSHTRDPAPQETVITGQLRPPEIKRWYHPDNTPPTWYRIDMTDMSQALGHSLEPYYVLESSPPAPLKPLPLRPPIPNNHLAYILTWYGLAFALCIMVFIYLRKEAHGAGTNHDS